MADRFVYTGQDNLEVMRHAVNYNRFLRQLAEDNIPSKDSYCVDFGAGSGTFAELLRDIGYSNIVCVEPDLELQKELKDKNFRVYGSLDDMDDNSVEVAYLFNVLEHIEKDHEVVELITAKIKPGGKLIVYVPAFNHLFSSMDVKVEHHRRYSRKMLKSVFEDAELGIDSNRYYDTVGYFATLAYKLAGSKKGDLDVSKVKLFDRYLFPVNRILDPLAKYFFGKNVMAVGRKIRNND